MEIHGLQKMTLLDYPGKVACTVFLAGCDFRCPYCHNSQLIDGSLPSLMDQEELLSFLDKRRGLLDGVCITGGEPLLRPDLAQLLEAVKALGYPVKLDTNGSHPQRLRALAAAGLVDYVAMDIKNSPQRYPETAGLPSLNLDSIRESAAFLLTGAVDYEFRTTVVAELHHDDDFLSIGQWLRGAKRYFLQAFADRDTVLAPGLHTPHREDMERWAGLLRPFMQQVELRGV